MLRFLEPFSHERGLAIFGYKNPLLIWHLDTVEKLTIGQRKLIKKIIENHPLVRSDQAKDRETFLKECGVSELRNMVDCKAEPFFFASRLVSDVETGFTRNGDNLLPIFLFNFIGHYGERVSIEERKALKKMTNQSSEEPDRQLSVPTPKIHPANGSVGKDYKDANFIMNFIREAVQAVPAVRWAVGVGGIAAVVALVSMPLFGLSDKVAFIGVIAAIGLMGTLVIFARMAQFSSELIFPAKIFTWFLLFLFMAVTVLLLSSGFFGYPREFSALFG